MSEVVSYRHQDSIGVITIDYPPVNALGQQVRQGLLDALAQGLADPNARVLLVVCSGRTFVAGADIREFGKPPQAPSLPEVITAFEDSAKPVIASIHGTALGGGLELALGCHYRIAARSAQVGLPEVKLGLLPGAGGTQRLPRLVGARKALEMITTGAFIAADEAHAAGVVDAIADGTSLENGLMFARQVMEKNWPARKVSAVEEKLREDRGSTVFEEFRAQLRKTSPNLFSPFKCVDAVESAFELPFQDGLKKERAYFLECMESPQRAGLIRVFLGEREVGKVPGLAADTPTREIKTVAIVGAGTMGQGIAMSFANAGFPVTLLEVGDDRLDHGMSSIRDLYAGSINKGKLSETQVEQRLALITPTLEEKRIADCDLVVEAVFEKMDAKKAVFARLDAICKPGAILATNTSTLDIDAIAAVTQRPADVIGMHFFSPAQVMRLVEVVRGEKTADDIKTTIMALTKKLKKIAVMVGNGYGFIGNRMLLARDIEAASLVNEGAAPQDVDRVLTNFGFPMGHFAMADLSGLDILAAIRQGLRDLGTPLPRDWLDELARLGRLGQKTGSGVYRYGEGSRKPLDNPETDALIAEVRKQGGFVERQVSDEEILERCLYAMVNEGAKLLERKIALRAVEIDIIWTSGFGFPAYRGGPMFWAEQQGLEKTLKTIEHYAERIGGEQWRPAALLRRLVVEGKGFS